MTGIEQKIREHLLSLQDLPYREFQCKLMPTVSPETVIGIRIPVVRAYAKELSKDPASFEFLSCLPHKYYEENNLHSFLLEMLKDYDECIRALDKFLPYVDNWSTCDSMKPRVFKKHLPELEEKIKDWLQAEHPYTVRFGIEMLMSFFLGAAFRPEYAELVAGVKSDEYYVNMMIAWYFATALARNYDQTVGYIEQNRLDAWTHNKTIQKAIESFRVTEEHKMYLRSLKR